MIWKHDDIAPLVRDHFRRWPRTCAHCNNSMELVRDLPAVEIPDVNLATQCTFLLACSACGWWKLERQVEGKFGSSHPFASRNRNWHRRCYGAAGALRSLDLADISVPVEEIRAYLTAKYGDRFDVHPRVFEEVVGGVMASLGYQARVTSYSNDGGIDVILDGPDSSTIGVQVKRWRQKIKVEQIRAFIGALILAGHTKGFFVTTSSFQSGANRIALESAERAVPVELIDSARFYDALKLSQVSQFDSASFGRELDTLAAFETLHLISYDGGGCNVERIHYIWGEIIDS